ncbi:hypothetical protein HMPREF9248_1181 [Fannyhessea vaginae PB189-T1-4]|uniref:Uncharacterized protein n=1 Tax=Fannyhessea vaginae PB189-T1-4 TaxID=866774 RepID=A0ABN0B1C6_9ACTN|nr:hypothetical protein HMPREF9248_1181 [Fannyhessea vaginae PB189-T1-4]
MSQSVSFAVYVHAAPFVDAAPFGGRAYVRSSTQHQYQRKTPV